VAAHCIAGAIKNNVSRDVFFHLHNQSEHAILCTQTFIIGIVIGNLEMRMQGANVVHILRKVRLAEGVRGR
jgi:hypothetical protein